MKGMKTLSIALVLIMVFSGAVVAGFFAKHHHGFGMGIGSLIRELNLSKDQKTELVNVIKTYQADMEQAADKLPQTMENLSEAMSAEAFNETDVRQAFQQLSSLGEELVVLRAKIFSQVKPILTPEQLETLKQKRAERIGKVKEHIAFRRSMFESWLGAEGE